MHETDDNDISVDIKKFHSSLQSKLSDDIVVQQPTNDIYHKFIITLYTVLLICQLIELSRMPHPQIHISQEKVILVSQVGSFCNLRCQNCHPSPKIVLRCNK